MSTIQPLILSALSSYPVSFGARTDAIGGVSGARPAEDTRSIDSIREEKRLGRFADDEVKFSDAARAVLNGDGTELPGAAAASQAVAADTTQTQATDKKARTEPGQASNESQEAGEAGESAQSSDAGLQSLSNEELVQVDKLKLRDIEVRNHELAHLAAAGQYATSGPKYSFQTGPDGQQYAIGGSVSIDTSPVPGDPVATLAKAQQIQAAATAPADPSGQDVKVAAVAAQMAQDAASQIADQNNATSSSVSSDSVSDNQTATAAYPQSAASGSSDTSGNATAISNRITYGNDTAMRAAAAYARAEAFSGTTTQSSLAQTSQPPSAGGSASVMQPVGTQLNALA